jgi:glutamate 5-kinase
LEHAIAAFMTDLLRQEIAATSHLLVVKVGTRVLTRDDGSLNEERIARLAEDLSAVADTGRRVVLVSSGAVGAGMGRLGLSKRPTDLATLQAVAAIGQARLIETYEGAFRRHNRHVGQVLLTAGDLDHRTSYLNVRNTLLALLEFGAIPIINENDTVAVDELLTTFGDNDRLAAMVTNLIRASLLVILSDIEGLYNGDPKDPTSRLVSTVPKIDETVYEFVRDKATGLSKGGMASKLEAARLCTSGGENVIIASGRRETVVRDVLAGQPLGTLFLAQGKSVTPWKRWIGLTAQPRGKVRVDDGARKAIVEDGRSLLAIGVVELEGKFQKGDIVSVIDGEGREFARGLTNYRWEDLDRIKRLKSDQIAQVLGRLPYKAVIHRDNMAVVRGRAG